MSLICYEVHKDIVLTFNVLCSVVNGALEYLAKDLGIAENTVLQGSILLTYQLNPSTS
jgi:hypothetical protein